MKTALALLLSLSLPLCASASTRQSPAAGEGATHSLLDALRQCDRVDNLIWHEDASRVSAVFWCWTGQSPMLGIWNSGDDTECTTLMGWPYELGELRIVELVDLPLDFFLSIRTAEPGRGNYSGPAFQPLLGEEDGEINTIVCAEGGPYLLHSERPMRSEQSEPD